MVVSISLIDNQLIQSNSKYSQNNDSDSKNSKPDFICVISSLSELLILEFQETNNYNNLTIDIIDTSEVNSKITTSCICKNPDITLPEYNLLFNEEVKRDNTKFKDSDNNKMFIYTGHQNGSIYKWKKNGTNGNYKDINVS